MQTNYQLSDLEELNDGALILEAKYSHSFAQSSALVQVHLQLLELILSQHLRQPCGSLLLVCSLGGFDLLACLYLNPTEWYVLGQSFRNPSLTQPIILQFE